jgi:hypothetical protein
MLVLQGYSLCDTVRKLIILLDSKQQKQIHWQANSEYSSGFANRRNRVDQIREIHWSY